MKIRGTVSQVIITKRGNPPQVRIDFLLSQLDLVQFQIWLHQEAILGFDIQEELEQLPLEPRSDVESDAARLLAAARHGVGEALEEVGER